MSRSAEVHLNVWDGSYSFRLRIGELEKLCERCDAGPAEMIRRLGEGTWRPADVRETLRLGLIGAGTTQADALDLIQRHVDPPFLMENTLVAQQVLLASIAGVSDERLGEQAAEPSSDPSQEVSSASPAFTEPAP